MNIQEKLEHLRNASMEEARDQGNAIIDQYSSSLEKDFVTHRQEAIHQSRTRIRAEKINLKQQLNISASRGQLDWKRENSHIQKKLKKQLFQEVDELLQNFMKTDEYTDLLVTYINRASDFAGESPVTFYINPTDESKLDELQNKTGKTLTVSKEDFTGGIRAVISDRHILIDDSFKSRRADAYEKFIFGGGGHIG